MKLLIIEIVTHGNELGGRYSMLSKLGHCDVIINEDLVSSIDRIPKANIVTVKIRYRSLHFHIFQLARIIRRYDYAFLNTSAEYWTRKVGGILISTSFFVLIFLTRSKIIPHVRNMEIFLKQDNQGSLSNLNSAILRASLRFVKRVTFDSETTKRAASMGDFLDNKMLAVMNFSYCGKAIRRKSDAGIAQKKKRISVGLLGRVETKRRDYGIIFNMLDQLKKGELQKLEFTIMGTCPDKEAVAIIKNLSKKVEVIWKSGHIPQKQFIEMGEKCDLFFASLSTVPKYGKSKETGAFGDAINFGKKVIIPRFACQTGEFDPISVYYNDERELLSIFKSIIMNPDNSDLIVSDTFLEKNSTNVLSKKIKKELRLI